MSCSRSARPTSQRIDGNLRIKSPTTVTTEFLGSAYTDFLQLHAGVDLEIVLVDRSVNPLEEGFDCAIGALPVSYPNVIDVPLCPYELVICCAPSYLRGRAEPRHPTELVDYECLTTTLFRTSWLFDSARGTLSVEVHSRLHSSDGRVMREAARRGLGIAVLARYLADEDIRLGRLVPLLQEFPLTNALAEGAGAAHEDESARGQGVRRRSWKTRLQDAAVGAPRRGWRARLRYS